MAGLDFLVTDIDNTIADTRGRLRRSLRAVGREEVFAETADQFGGFDDYLAPEEEEEFWRVFLSGKFLHHDRPAPGAAEFLGELKEEGVEIFYLTGRHDQAGDSMRAGTEAWLRENDFPDPAEAGISLFMKPTRKKNDREFKLELLEEKLSTKSPSVGAIGIGDHPDDAFVYNRVGIRPVLLNWLGLFSPEELRNSASRAKVVASWPELEEELPVLLK